MTTSIITPLEPGNRIHLPTEWADALGLRGLVALDKTAEGILVRPCQPTWDEFFATKLPMGSGAVPEEEDVLEVSGDDLLF